MARIDYDRYNTLKNKDGSVDFPPLIKFPNNQSYQSVTWKLGYSRLDKLAQTYYQNPFFDFLIKIANPQYLEEEDIPDGAVIRIPFPLQNSKLNYESAMEAYKQNGIIT